MDSFIRKTYSSRAARRAVAREDLLCGAAFDAIDNSKDENELAQRLHASVFGTELYAKLPKFRQASLVGFVEGAVEMRERMKGARSKRSAPPSPIRVPRWVDVLQPGATWRRHPLGGGWVSSTAYVASTAYVGPTVVIFDRARVLDQARVQGDGTRVFGDAEVWGLAHVFGGALIHGETQLCDRCNVSGVEIEQGRVDGTTELKQQRDTRILTTRERAETIVPPPGFALARGV